MAFPTGVSGTSVLTTAIKPKYDTDFLLAYDKTTVWRQKQFINWQDDMGPVGTRGSSIVFNVWNTVQSNTTPLPELSDRDPTEMSLGTVTVTPDEYGDVLQFTAKAQVESYNDIPKAAAALSGEQQAKTLDIIARDTIMGGTWVEYAGGATSRTGLDTTNDKVTMGTLTVLKARMMQQWVPGFRENNTYAAITSPLAMPDIMADGTWLAVQEYSGSRDGILKGEVGEFAGFAFITHPLGKIFYSGGTVAQTATTVATSPVAAGDTTFAVATSTGLAVGDYISVGTLESRTHEVVKITSGASSPYTIQGIGTGPSNFGFRFAHAVGEAVTEAANVGAIVALGRTSVHGVAFGGPFGGKMGDHGMDWKPTNIPQRFMTAWWKWGGGFALYQKHAIRLEFAITTNTIDVAVR